MTAATTLVPPAPVNSTTPATLASPAAGPRMTPIGFPASPPLSLQPEPAAPRWRVRPVPSRTPLPIALVPDPVADVVQETLDFELPRTRTHLRLLPEATDTAPALTPLAHLPDAEDFSARIAVTLMEVIAGRRPITHIGRVTSPEVYASLERRRMGGRACDVRMRPVRVRRVVGGSPREGVFDAAVVVDDRSRVRAMAIRLLGIDGRWLVTELRLT